MTDSEKIQILLEKCAIMEEALKMLLVNDVLQDAENLTGKKQDSVQFGALQKDFDKLQKTLKAKETEISKLQSQLQKSQSQLETQKARIKTLQDLVDSKERTIQFKEERIQGFQKQIADYTAAAQNPKAHQLIGKQWKLVSGTNSDFVLDAYTAGNGTPVCVNHPSNGMNQLFMIEHHANNYFVIKNVGSGKVLDLDYGKVVIGGKIQLWSFNGTDAQLWKLEDLGDNDFMFRSKLNPSYCIGIPFHQSGRYIVLCKSSDSTYTKYFHFSAPASIKQYTEKVVSFKIGQRVKLHPNCKYCYVDSYSESSRCLVASRVSNPASYIYTVTEKANGKYCLRSKNQWGQNFQFWVNADMIVPC